MANLTKGQLAAENAALRTEINTLREQMRQLNGDLADALRGQVKFDEAAQAVTRERLTKPQRTAYEMPDWQLVRKAKMDAAREAAMQMRCMVKV